MSLQNLRELAQQPDSVVEKSSQLPVMNHVWWFSVWIISNPLLPLLCLSFLFISLKTKNRVRVDLVRYVKCYLSSYLALVRQSTVGMVVASLSLPDPCP